MMLAALLMAGCNAVQTQDAALTKAEMLREKILSGDTSSVLVVAHRGDWRFAPENSIAAIEHSIKTGVDIVELDLQLTKDSILIVMHDSKLDRTTTGKGRVSDWTLDSIRTLKLKNGASIRTKHSVPTLEEALIAAKGKVLINLDKADRYFDLVMPVLERTGTAQLPYPLSQSKTWVTDADSSAFRWHQIPLLVYNQSYSYRFLLRLGYGTWQAMKRGIAHGIGVPPNQARLAAGIILILSLERTTNHQEHYPDI